MLNMIGMSDGVQTSNLDGETNLKIRKALERTWEYITADSASELRGGFAAGASVSPLSRPTLRFHSFSPLRPVRAALMKQEGPVPHL